MFCFVLFCFREVGRQGDVLRLRQEGLKGQRFEGKKKKNGSLKWKGSEAGAGLGENEGGNIF